MTTSTTKPTKSDVLAQAVVFDNDAVTTAWQASKLNHLQLVSVDKEYRALPKKTWDAILATHLTLHPYTEDYFDCDGFSAVFMGFVLWDYEVNGLARIMDFSGHHSYNAVLVCNDGKTCEWHRVEPQTDLFYADPPPQGMTMTVPGGAYAATAGFAVTA